MITLNDVIITILAILGVLLLIFAFIWYQLTIRNHPAQDQEIPLIAFREMKK
jgi:hypothetical protein